MKNGVREQGIFNDHLVYRNENTQTRNINVPRLKNASDSQRAKKTFRTICTRLLGECIWLGLIGWKSNCSPTCAWKLSGKSVSQLSKRGAASQRFEAKLNGFWLLEIECKNFTAWGRYSNLYAILVYAADGVSTLERPGSTPPPEKSQGTQTAKRIWDSHQPWYFSFYITQWWLKTCFSIFRTVCNRVSKEIGVCFGFAFPIMTG